MPADLWVLYEMMFNSRCFEEAVRQVWLDSKISGEMHMGLGEEAIVAGVVSQMIEGDAMALDHRGTAPLLMRGVDPTSLLREFMGKPDGLCGGKGGHMHLFAPDKLAASSGIIGASGPAAAGFALASQMLRPGTVSVAFFGEGATSQGMFMESMNLAVVWNLPVVFVCKDNSWSLSTPSSSVVGGNLLARAKAQGMKAWEMDGADVEAVFNSTQDAIHFARSGQGPVFLWAHCIHLEGHFLGDGLLDMIRRPLYSLRKRVIPMIKAFFKPGGSWREKLASMLQILGFVFEAQGQLDRQRDPIQRTRKLLGSENKDRLERLETLIRTEINKVVTEALQLEGVEA